MSFDYAKKIGALIANAEDESLSEEARKLYRLKAEQLMREYRVAEEDAIAKDEAASLPRRFEVVLLQGNAFNSDLRAFYVDIWQEVALHAGVKSFVEYRYRRTESDEPNRMVAVGYGYDLDVRLAEFLWTAAHLVFVARVDARVNPELSDQENCYYLRNSGMKRNDIANQLWGSAYDDGPAHGKVQKLYLAECAKRGEEPKVSGRGIQVKLYRAGYANGFCDEFGWRLREARDAADSAGGGLVLHGRAERVAEAFYEAFPNRRPKTSEEAEAYWKTLKEQEANCEGCKKTKSKTGKCSFHRPREATQADRKRWARQDGAEAKAGRANGTAAARSVDFSRSAGPRTRRAESAPERPALGG